MSRILHKDFRYTPAARQSIEHMKSLFAKERARLAEEAEAREKALAEAHVKVRQIKGAK